MSYAIAAYAITVGTLAFYAWSLVRERRRLERGGASFAQRAEGERGSAD